MGNTNKKYNIKELIPNYVYFSFILIGVGGVLSSILSSNSLDSLLSTFKLLFIGFGIFFTLIYNLIDGLKPKIIIYTLIVGVGIFAVFTIFDFYKIYALTRGLNIRSIGLSDHITNAAGVLGIGLCSALAIFQSTKQRILPIFLIGTIGLALIFTGSVSGLLSVTIAILLSKNTKSSFNFKGKILSLTFFLVAVYFIQRYEIYDVIGRIQSATSGRYNTLNTRELNITAGIHGIFSSVAIFFFGTGLGGETGFVLDSTGGFFQVHNSLIQAWYQGGILTVIGIFIVWVRPILQSGDSSKFSANQAFQMSATCAVIFGMTSPIMNQRYIWIPILCLIASKICEWEKLSVPISE